MISATSESHAAGTSPGAGTFSCIDCSAHLSLRELDELPACPRCGGAEFRRASMFDPLPAASDDGTIIGEDGATEPSTGTIEFEVPGRPRPRPRWIAELRDELPGPGRYLAWEDEGAVHFHELARGWNRIGRSATADLRLDDPTVSRRHALLVWEPGKRLRVLDDRSLNGIFLNGELVEWAGISDGDELAIGRYRLVLIES